MKDLQIEDIDNLDFWINYFAISYPNAYDEEKEISVSDLMDEMYTSEIGSWWEGFTNYYEGVLEESDGYLDEPTRLITSIAQDKTLKIEFHPGDVLYFINNEQIGSTGPHWKLQVIPYENVEQLLSCENGRQLFLLLLPLVWVKAENAISAQQIIKEQMEHYFSESICDCVSKCIICGLVKDSAPPQN